MELLAFILSNLATVCVCIPSLLKGKNMKLILLSLLISMFMTPVQAALLKLKKKIFLMKLSSRLLHMLTLWVA
jgi:hypothetical protein